VWTRFDCGQLCTTADVSWQLFQLLRLSLRLYLHDSLERRCRSFCVPRALRPITTAVGPHERDRRGQSRQVDGGQYKGQGRSAGCQTSKAVLREPGVHFVTAREGYRYRWCRFGWL